MTSDEVASLFEDLADGWRSRDYARVAARFASDVVYGDPTRYMLRSRDALLAFFRDDDGREQHIDWHAIVFDERRQSGAAEYTYEGTFRYHGVALFEVRGATITRWREYQHVDTRTFDAFVEGPEPQPAL
jgi:nuclear transport factor 2 (NTF2) superfamily protein